ncbi:response regulator receiver protein [Pseudomonas sp. M47T1]|uniref:response regulator transcription factor n=1 Tax=unclassified Pseudomonas TaxID=196821 RepID=UPI0002607288|nr:response regulator [Pseudomonas sp. M47T1]EIK95729.1 response regulator receiver protein [Pseudomonas sp. M47T1]
MSVDASALPLHVCIVDDDGSVRKSLANLLRALGYHSAGFASGEQFLASEQSRQAACVLLDVRMPGLSGFEVQQQLQARHDPIAVICMSAHDDPATVSRALAGGARGFLHKPFSESALLASLAVAMDRPA